MLRPFSFAAAIVLVSGCGLLGKKVSQSDCVKWDKHYREALEETAKKTLGKCKDDPAAKGYLKSLDENIAANADGIATGCQSVINIGGYTAEEEKCFMGTTDATAWGKCELKPTSAVGLYVKAGDNTSKTWKGLCSSKSSDDDDADSEKPKKKKKKKSDDDD